jgi:tellurite resistance protein
MDHQSPPSIREFDEPKLEALVETMFLAAFADREFGDEERAEFTKGIESLTDRRISGELLGRLMERILADLQASGRRARLAAVKERLPDADARKTALSLAIQVVAADGIIRTSERELILDAAEELEIDRDEAADLVKSIAG